MRDFEQDLIAVLKMGESLPGTCEACKLTHEIVKGNSELPGFFLLELQTTEPKLFIVSVIHLLIDMYHKGYEQGQKNIKESRDLEILNKMFQGSTNV